MSDNPPMETQSSSIYVAEFCARTRRLREGAGMSQTQMAAALGIEPDAYRKYETRSPLPHRLIAQFAAIVGVTVNFLMTGQNGEPRSRPRRRIS